MLAALESVAQGQVLERQDVENSGRGKNPKFDFQFTIPIDGQSATVVCQIERYWNPSSVDLLRRKINRALLDTTVVSRALVVVPDEGLATLKTAVRGISGVVILAESQFEDVDLAGARVQRELTSGRR
ncbi:hypothetical protein NS330_15920 [Curtobacterium citreum]|nr:hypothetical protein NS330_15920 [Curtobacterium citreum]